jgi:hypothetical protein
LNTFLAFPGGSAEWLSFRTFADLRPRAMPRAVLYSRMISKHGTEKIQ